jgi:hypothetical protein
MRFSLVSEGRIVRYGEAVPPQWHAPFRPPLSLSAPAGIPKITMTSTACLLAWALALLLLPVLFIAWLTESRTDRVRRWHAGGMSQTAIAARLGISRYQVRKALI